MDKLYLDQAQINKAKDDEVQETYEAMVSPNVVDRDGERIEPKAYKKSIKQYLEKNPVVFFNHNWAWVDGEKELPIGKAISAKITDEGLKAKFVFSPLPFAQQVKTLVDEGFLNTVSVGFLPKEWESDVDGVRVYTDVEIIEFSVVNIPANQAATIMRQMKDEGVDVKKIKSIYDSLSKDLSRDKKSTKVEKSKKELTYYQKIKLLYKDK